MKDPKRVRLSDRGPLKTGAAKQGDRLTKQKILRCAADIFARKGFAATTTREIGEAVGIHYSSLYHHFRSKEEIYAAVVEDLCGRLMQGLERVLDASQPPEEKLETLIRAYFDFMAENPQYARIAVNEYASGGRHLAQFVPRFVAPIYDKARKFFDEITGSRRVRPIDTRQLILSCIGLVETYFYMIPWYRALFGEDALSPENLARRRDAVVDLIFNGVLKRAP
ncbi:MAG: hypothetical protein A2Y95_02205 [Deltaproteobacteria bacterium RBG_13_65_10]|nr:MAG: hypothetical protein A2Y95_02205 [Deltaproteobacteria bacterium RBG_13_65_10]